ncbi:MAG: LysR family transcriptional regulator [Pseudomonadales bacterium]|nr:LysR family transcriptional regulator [Pseudomonadales bacterium]
MHDLNALRAFLAVVESGSFSQAARLLNCANSSISRQVGQLEQQLGQTLLIRSTRSVATTDAGAELFERAHLLLPQLEAACSSLPTTEGQPAGKLRVSVPWWFSKCHIGPLLTAFHNAYPDIKIELIANDALVDVLADGFDVAIRVSYLKDSELIAKPLGAHSYTLTASPRYLNQHPAITHPKDLAAHQLISFVLSTPFKTWVLRKNQESFRISTEHSWLRSNHAELLYQSAIDGGGIIVQPHWGVREALARGALVQVLTEYEVTSTRFDNGIYAVYSKHQRQSTKIKAFVGFLEKQWTLLV